MKNLSSFRITALTCFFFALVSMIPYFRPWSWYMAATAALVLLGTFAAVRFRHPALRLLVSLAALAVVVVTALYKDLFLGLVCAVPVVVSAVIVTLKRETREIHQLRREFIILCGVGFVLLFFALNPLFYSLSSIVYVGLALLFGILALRAGRAGSYRSARWQAGNAGFFLLPVTVAGVVGIGLGFGFDRLMNWLSQFFVDFRNSRSDTTPMPLEEQRHIRFDPTPDPFITASPTSVATEPPEQHATLNLQQLDWRWVFIAILVLIALAILIRVLLRNRKKASQEQSVYDVETHPLSTRKNRGRHKRKQDEPNRDKVRELYRRYLSFLRMKGVRIRYSETSQEISDSAKDVANDDSVLREIYRKSRYGSEETVTDEDVRLAAETFERLTAPPAQTGEQSPSA